MARVGRPKNAGRRMVFSLGFEDDALVCAISRALAHACGRGGGGGPARPRALLLLPSPLRRELHGALARVASFLDARERGGGGDGSGGGPPLCAAAQQLCAGIPPATSAADFERVAVKYFGAGGEDAGSKQQQQQQQGARAPPPPPPPLLNFAAHLHLLPPDAAPSWVGLVAPERLCGGGGGAEGGAADVHALAAALALLGSAGRGGEAVEVHAQMGEGGWERCGHAAQRLLRRACVSTEVKPAL